MKNGILFQKRIPFLMKTEKFLLQVIGIFIIQNILQKLNLFMIQMKILFQKPITGCWVIGLITTKLNMILMKKEIIF